MFSICFSNRYEILLEALLLRLGEVQPDPFGQRQVIVPGAALQRSVELAVAQREGVAANLRFSYLAGWLWQEIDRLVAVGAQSPYAPSRLCWRIFGLLGEKWPAAYPRLGAYLQAADVLMRFELAERIARLFDSYIAYRPHWLERWERSQAVASFDDGAQADEAWQAELWRRIRDSQGERAGLYGEHPANAFFRQIESLPVDLVRQSLPGSVHVFCMPAMPPLYLDILRRLARWVEVRLYVLNPCREYWFEIVPPRSLTWLAAQQRDLYHESGNRLLAGWGRQTQANIDLLFSGEHGALVEESVFLSAAECGNRSLLGRVQDAILDLAELEPGSVVLDCDDRSIEVHVCHSLTRELEVLHDRLLDLCSGPHALRPDEILVVTPDLEAAAPLIEAVFAAAPPHRSLPWHISGLGQTRINPLARILDMALTLLSGRFPATGLFELLQQPPVAQQFDLSGEDLQQVHEWLLAAGVHWGLDGEQRGLLGLPDGERHSLTDGLHRLFLAYACGAESGTVFAGRTAASNPEGGNALVLGRFWRYAEVLQRMHEQCAKSHDADGWRQLLLALLDSLIPSTPEWAEPLRSVYLAVNELHSNMVSGGMRGAVALPLVQTALVALFDDPARGGMPGGTVIFSALGGLRNLPYRAICVIGLDDGAFPGCERPAEFDLIAQYPMRGDRQRRQDERNLFLDLLLAARETLHLSYSGRSARDNSEKLPSTLVDELLDYLARACADSPHDPASLVRTRCRLTVEHPLQAFSSDYFTNTQGKDARLFSFNDEYCSALQQRLQRMAEHDPPSGRLDPRSAEGFAPRAGAVPFFSTPLPDPEAEWRMVELDGLIRFFRHPCRFLLTERLGLRLAWRDETLENHELFIPDWAARQRLAQRLLPLLLVDSDHGHIQALASAAAIYPDGYLGDYFLESELADMQSYADMLRPECVIPPLPTVAAQFDTRIHDEVWRFSADLSDVRPNGLVRYRYDNLRASDALGAWISHLALCIAAPDGVVRQTCWHARDGIYRWRPVDNAQEILNGLLVLYRQGLCEPLPFFPKTAWVWMSERRSQTKAEQRWLGGQYSAGESQELAIRLCFRGQADPLGPAFYELAAQIFEPLYAHLSGGGA